MTDEAFDFTKSGSASSMDDAMEDFLNDQKKWMIWQIDR